MNDRVERGLTWALALVLLVSLLGVVYISVNPPETTPPYTEFYVLGEAGMAAEYPTNLSAGERGTVTVGISNHEHQEMSYTVVVAWDNETTQSIPVTVTDEETVERDVTIRAPAEPGRHEVRLLLYRGSETGDRIGVGDRPPKEPYRWLRLWVTVSAVS